MVTGKPVTGKITGYRFQFSITGYHITSTYPHHHFVIRRSVVSTAQSNNMVTGKPVTGKITGYRFQFSITGYRFTDIFSSRNANVGFSFVSHSYRRTKTGLHWTQTYRRRGRLSPVGSGIPSI